MLGIALLSICFVTKAIPRYNTNLTADEVISNYINAIAHGKTAGLDKLIDNEATVSLTRGASINSLDKQKIVRFLKLADGIEQDCRVSLAIVQDNEDARISKVEMKYNDFTRVDVIKVQPAAGGWKITRIEISYR